MKRHAEEHDRLPLAPHVLQILVSVLDRPQHGYAIIKEISERTEGEMQLGTSTLYSAIKRMVAAGLLVETDPPAAIAPDDARRRYYVATLGGVCAARIEVERMRHWTHILEKEGVIAKLGVVGRGGAR